MHSSIFLFTYAYPCSFSYSQGTPYPDLSLKSRFLLKGQRMNNLLQMLIQKNPGTTVIPQTINSHIMSRCADCRLPIHSQSSSESNVTRCNPCLDVVSNPVRIRLTPVERRDLELLYAWRSHPEIYRHSRTQEGPLDWNAHVNWFESRSDERYDFLIHHAGRRVGLVSISEEDYVSIYLGDHSAQGRGVATRALKWLCRRFANRKPLLAEIHYENEPSLHLFERCDFERIDRDGDWLVYSYDP